MRLRAVVFVIALLGVPAAGHAQAWEKDGRAVVAWLAPGDAGVHLQLQFSPRH